LDLEIALGGVSAKIQPRAAYSAVPKVSWNVGWRNQRRIYQHFRQPYV